MKKSIFPLLKLRSFGASVVLLAGIVFLIFKWADSRCSKSAYIPVSAVAQHQNGLYFSGSKVCAECHAEIYGTHLQTAHFNSSAEATIANIMGSFEADKNSLQLNESISFQMNIRANVAYQDVFLTSDDSLLTTSRFDVTIGSGTKGQSYLNWQENGLYQLQGSYFRPGHIWINSPGYPSTFLKQKRPISKRCLECHTTFAKSTPSFAKRNSYDKSQMMYGIDCERCHGPALAHVNFHKKNPQEIQANHMVAYDTLRRQQRLDACALCHSGIRTQSNANAFAFVVGDTLKRYSAPSYDEESLKNLDVHGNQYGLLSASKCFKKSEMMDCNTCHNPHENQRGGYHLFNKICQDCHTPSKDMVMVVCSEKKEIKKSRDNSCIQCHMPMVSSKSMKIDISNDSIQSVQVRTHYIGVYADALVKKL